MARIIAFIEARFECLSERKLPLIAIGDHAEGCILPVRAQPGAKRNAVLGEQGGSLKVAITAPPAEGRANQALLELLREALELKRSQIELIGGATSREKRFLVRGTTKEQLAAKLVRLLNL